MPKIMRQIKNEYKKYGDIPKSAYRIEIGSKGGIHIHLLITEICTDVPGVTGRQIVSKFWKYGGVHEKPIYEAGGFEGIAVYLCKEADKSKDGKAKQILYPYVPSKNWNNPEHEVKVYKRMTMRAIIEEVERRLEEQRQMRDRYREHFEDKYKKNIIDELTYKKGINPFNGMSYLRFTEVMRIQEGVKYMAWATTEKQPWTYRHKVYCIYSGNAGYEESKYKELTQSERNRLTYRFMNRRCDCQQCTYQRERRQKAIENIQDNRVREMIAR